MQGSLVYRYVLIVLRVYMLFFFLLCQDTKLSMICSRVPKSWNVPAPIRYVKVTTINFTEVLLLGLFNGQVSKHLNFLLRTALTF